MTNKYFREGFAPAILIIIMVLLLGGAGAGIYFWQSKKTSVPPKNLLVNETREKTSGTLTKEEIVNTVDDVIVETPEFDFSNSPLPAIAAPVLNLNGGEVAGDDIFADVDVNDDFSYDKDVEITKPTYDLGVEVAPSAAVEPPANNPTPPETQAPATDCSAFASAPNCSYVGAPGSDAYQACKQCYPDK